MNSITNGSLENGSDIALKYWSIDSSRNFSEYLCDKVKKTCVIDFAKDQSIKLTSYQKACCKIFKFTPDWNYDEILLTIGTLNRHEFPNLFIFIISTNKKISPEKSDENLQKLQEKIINFSPNRPQILQSILESEDIVKFYYKDVSSRKFESVRRLENKSEWNFSSFLSAILDGHMNDILHVIIDDFDKVQNLQLILQFLQLMEVDKDLFSLIILKCAEYGSKKNLMTILNIEDGRLLTEEAQEYLTSIWYENSEPPETDQTDGAIFLESNIKDTDIDKLRYQSVLSVSIDKLNQEVIDYLINDCRYCIQELPFEHKVQISSMVFKSKQFDLLCDLVEQCDFPFSKNFVDAKFRHDKLQGISEKRKQFANAIKENNVNEISSILEDIHTNCKLFYNLENKSVLKQAVESKNYSIYFDLVSKGFQSSEFKTINEILSDDELIKANIFCMDQRIRNVDESKTANSISKLNIKSRIYSQKIEADQETEYRKKIKKWYGDISKIKFGKMLLEIAASCDYLIIVFDFESNTVEKVSLNQNCASGSTYICEKQIFIGAKLFDENSGINREQKIKGVLAHELCHYVLRLVFENNENPYYEHKTEIIEIFKSIVNNIDKWSTKNGEYSVVEDDECNSIISSVFTLYESKDFHQELIVRVLQILAHFDDNNDKLMLLQNKFRILFEFFENFVFPEFQKFDINKRIKVRKLNRSAKLLANISNFKLKVSIYDDITKQIIENKLSVVTTNCPKLLLLNIYNFLNKEYGKLLNTEFIFVDIKFLNDEKNLKYLFKIISKYCTLKIIVNCSRAVKKEVIDIVNDNFTFVLYDKNLKDELVVSISQKTNNFLNKELNFNWSDLPCNDQKALIDTKINFQKNNDYSIFDLLENCTKQDRSKEQKEKEVLEYFKIPNFQLLNFLFENLQISINVNLEKHDSKDEDEFFEFLFQPRQLIKKIGWVETKVSLDDNFYNDIKKEKYIIISDVAGTGKSWIIKKIVNDLKIRNPKNWISYIDLKQYTENFETMKNYNFLSFTEENIFKFKNYLEATIFYKLYSSGKMMVFFDGFDEIDSKNAEIVLKLVESFDECNAGNQLWISTRDLYEVKIRERIKSKLIFKLNEFSQNEGINLIAKNWVVEDIKCEESAKSTRTSRELEEFLKNSTEFEVYKNKGLGMIKKISMTGSHSIGLPRLFKMAADGFKKDSTEIHDLKEFKIFEKIIDNLFLEFKKKKIQSKNFNFMSFHQFVAIKTSFPEIKYFFGIDSNKYDLPNDEHSLISALDLIAEKDGQYFIRQETFQDFFIADYIFNKFEKVMTLNESDYFIKKYKEKMQNSFLEIFVKVLTLKKFEVVRLFLNDAFNDFIILNKVFAHNIGSFSKYFHTMESFDEFFTHNLENLLNLIIKILGNVNSAKIFNILDKSISNICSNTKSQESFLLFQKFLFERTDKKSLKKLIKERTVFQSIAESSQDIDIFETFVREVKNKTDREFITEALKLTSYRGNIFHRLCLSTNFDNHKIQSFLKFLEDFLKKSEIIDLMKICNSERGNILHVCIWLEDHKKLQIIWKQTINFLSQEYFEEFLVQKTRLNQKTIKQVLEDLKVQNYDEYSLESFGDHGEFENLILEMKKY